MVEEESPQEKIQAKIENFMENIFRIVAICIGIPPKVFTWEYYDKAKQQCVVENVKPIEFYETLVKPFYDVEQKVRRYHYIIFTNYFTHPFCFRFVL